MFDKPKALAKLITPVYKHDMPDSVFYLITSKMFFFFPAECPMYKPSVLKKAKEPETQESNEKQSDNEPRDPLAPENHQQLSLLLYSYSNKSANVPDFCVNPWWVQYVRNK